MLGHGGMALIHFAIGIFVIIDFNAGVLIGICAFLVIYQNSSGPVAYAYASETCCDIALGMCILALYSAILVLSLSTEPLMDSPNFGTEGVFFMLGVFMVIATITVYMFVGETLGLQKAQKKLLFVPGGPWGRKLQEGEVPHSPAPLDRQGRYNLV